MTQTEVSPQLPSRTATEQMNNICLDDVTGYQDREEKAARTIQVRVTEWLITEIHTNGHTIASISWI